MSGLRLVLRAPPPGRVDLSGLLPSRLAGLSVGAIERLPLAAGLVVGDLFEVRPGEVAEITIEGGSERFDGVGAALDGGVLRLEGVAGQLAGAGMTGGRLDLRGATGRLAAAGLQGGTIEIAGDTGDDLGAPLAAERVGMAGGLVVVRGSAGARAGDRLRRGVLVVEGDAGDLAGARMIAGTLIVCGRAGADAGTLMRRGTLVLGRGTPGPTFARTGRAPPVFAGLLARYLLRASCSSQPAGVLLGRQMDRFMGDLATLGKGEIFLPV